MTFRQHLILAFKVADNPLDFIFHIGYQQLVLPRWFRRAFARGRMHKAWLQGFHGWWIGRAMERSAWDSEMDGEDYLNTLGKGGSSNA